MKLTSYIKHLLFIIAIFTATNLFASEKKTELPLYKMNTVVTLDTIPPKKPATPDDKKQKPENAKKPEVKEVPKARPMPKPKVVGPKVKPVKIIRPRVGPKF